MSISGILGVASKIPTADFCAGTRPADSNESAEHLFQPPNFLFDFVFKMRLEGTHLNNKSCSHLVNRWWGWGPSDLLLRCFKLHVQAELLEACLRLWG